MPRFSATPALLLLLALCCQSCASLESMRVMAHDYLHPPEDPLSAQEHLDLGLAYEQQGDLEQAGVQYEKAVSELPQAWLLLGNLRYAQGRPEEAVAAYEQAVEAMPDNAEACNNLAWVYHELGMRPERARELAEHALSLAPRGGEGPYLDTLMSILGE